MFPKVGTRLLASSTVLLVLISVFAPAALAQPSLPVRPAAPPPGLYFTTDEEEARRHAAFWQQLKAEAQHPLPKEPGDFSVASTEGDIRIVGPSFAYGSGLIENDRASGIARVIWEVSLKILETTWRRVGSIISNVAWLYNLTVDQSQPALAKAYRSHSYYVRRGDFYRSGSWWIGVLTERRDTYALGWAAFYDFNGVPHARFENNGVGHFLFWQPSCHFWDDPWIRGMTALMYRLNRSVSEAWNECMYFNP